MVVGLGGLTLLINAVQRDSHLPRQAPNPIVLTAKRLDRLQTLIQNYVDEHQRLPGDTLEGALATLAESGVDFSSPSMQAIASGCDVWERPLIYVPTDQGTLIVRSIGSNGHHEHGGGDDIQRIIQVDF